ncbi:MAG: HNH endonuclease, partial [Deltaproteobacteria bacterium]|nr:HNH endonuclease [Deltaproteobacteria bacterium]
MKINGRTVSEHRYVMEQVLDRELLPGELVHHKNGDKFDNRPDNLEISGDDLHIVDYRIVGPENRVPACPTGDHPA